MPPEGTCVGGGGVQKGLCAAPILQQNTEFIQILIPEITSLRLILGLWFGLRGTFFSERSLPRT